MNRVLLGTSLGLSVIALGMVLFSPSKVAEPTPVVAAGPSVDPADVKLLERRIEQLEQDNDHLYRRLREVELATGAPADAGVRVALVPSVAPVDTNALKDAVKDVQRELAIEAGNAWREKMRERMNPNPEQQQAHWKAFSADAGLSWAQEQALLGRVDDEAKRRAAIFADVENGSRPRGDLRGTLQQISRDTEDELKKTLDAAQLEKFKNERRAISLANFRRPR